MAQREGSESPYPTGYDRRRFLRQAAIGVAGVATGALLEACGSSSTATTTTAASSGATGGMAALTSSAKSEGALNVIALPPTWANYGNIIDTFKTKYGLTVNSANPDGTSAEELQSVKSLKGQSNEPDVVDVSPSIAEEGVAAKVFAPYKVSTWSTIPANMKDPSGLWYGDYYGVISFGTNLSVVKNAPTSWDDLKKPEYKGQVAIDGDPRSAGDSFAAVFAASLANGGTLDDIMPGIEFFKELKSLGNFNPTDCYPSNISKGTTPIAIVWDYLNLGYKTTPAVFSDPSKYAVSIPTTGKFGNFYCQAISASAPHPKAAELWEEFIYSDEGQLLYLAGYAHPARYADLASRNAIPASLQAKLPPASEYAGVVFPNEDQTTKAAAALASNWATMVGGA